MAERAGLIPLWKLLQGIEQINALPAAGGLMDQTAVVYDSLVG